MDIDIGVQLNIPCLENIGGRDEILTLFVEFSIDTTNLGSR